MVQVIFKWVVSLAFRSLLIGFDCLIDFFCFERGFNILSEQRFGKLSISLRHRRCCRRSHCRILLRTVAAAVDGDDDDNDDDDDDRDYDSDWLNE
jgi:hypothetical protein